MTCKLPDTQLSGEIRELNLEFLELLRRSIPAGSAFGLDGATCQRIRELPGLQLEAIAATPCLLAGFAELPPYAGAFGVAEPPMTRRSEATGLFVAGLMTYLWQVARRDRLLAALCIGPLPSNIDRFANAGFRDVQRSSAAATAALEARFCRHPRVWPDLVRAATSRDPDIVTATHLSVIQIALVARPPDSGAEAPRTGRIPRGHPPAR